MVFNSSRIDHRPLGNHSYGYGFQWWIHPGKEIFSAWGYAEQRVIVVPKSHLVTVFTSYMPNVFGDPAGDMVNMFVIPAIFGITSTTSTVTSKAISTTVTSRIPFFFLLSNLLSIVILRKCQRKKIVIICPFVFSF